MGGGERDSVARPCGLDAQGDRQMRLSSPGWAQEHDVAGLGEEVEVLRVARQPQRPAWAGAKTTSAGT